MRITLLENAVHQLVHGEDPWRDEAGPLLPGKTLPKKMSGALAGEYHQRIGRIARILDTTGHLFHEVRPGRDERYAHEIFLTVPMST